jgi:tetratricopeptide (TPR) repeat protein
MNSEIPLEDLYMLAIELRDKYAHTREIQDLQAALKIFQQLVQILPADSPLRSDVLCNVGHGLHVRYQHSDDPADLDAAITAFQQAVQVANPDSPDLPDLLCNLGVKRYERYERCKELTDLDSAIDDLRKAVMATSVDSPDRPTRMSILGLALYLRYKITEQSVDLQGAFGIFERIVQISQPDTPQWADAQHHLGNLLLERSSQDEHEKDLDLAIVTLQQALQATQTSSCDWPGILLNLGRGWFNRYLRESKPVDLEAAIDAFQTATTVLPPDSTEWTNAQFYLGSGLDDRYKRSRKLVDLQASIEALEKAAQTMPANHSDWPILLNTLGNALYERYLWSGKPEDVKAGESYFRQANEATPPGSPNRPLLLNDQGKWLSVAGSEDLAVVDTSIKVFRLAIQNVPEDARHRSGYLYNNIGHAFYNRYHLTLKVSDLREAIVAYTQAVQITSPDLHAMSTLLTNMGEALYALYVRRHRLADLQASIAAWEKSWQLSYTRFVALTVNYQVGQQQQGKKLVAQLITAYLEQAGRKFAYFLPALRRSLELAEGSKSRLLTQLVGRGPLPLPAHLSLEVADQEQELLNELTIMDTQELASYGFLNPDRGEGSYYRRLQRRQIAFQTLETLWESINNLGQEGAAYVDLRRGSALTWQEFIDLAQTLGPTTALLSFYETEEHLLLFLLRENWSAPRFVSIPLKKTDWTTIMECFHREIRLYVPGTQRGETWERSLIPLLTKVQPLLVGVKRLILSPSGNGHLLPWSVLIDHAHLTSPEQPLPLVSLPALSILPRLQQRPYPLPGPALIVGNPRQDKPLPFAEDEARQVAEFFSTQPLLGAAATKSAVLARLPEATLIHLATHAAFDSANPLESGILLADGVLTAREVLQYRLQADLLVLSACESGQVGILGGEELAGLSQAFLQAGVRSVLVSLWQVDDLATTTLILTFFRKIQTGADKALALRQAMTDIQQDPRWKHPYYWGAFVLIGDWNSYEHIQRRS